VGQAAAQELAHAAVSSSDEVAREDKKTGCDQERTARAMARVILAKRPMPVARAGVKGRDGGLEGG
jgi:hypothetical protein